MKKPILIGMTLVVGWFLLFFILPEFREDLPALRDYVQVMKEEYPTLDKVKYRYARSSFEVDVFVSGMEESEDIKKDLQTFLSSEEFRAEFLLSPETRQEEGGSSGLVPCHPDIWISCYPRGEKESQWASYAMYYTQPYRSDRILEIDGYQTWYNN